MRLAFGGQESFQLRTPGCMIAKIKSDSVEKNPILLIGVLLRFEDVQTMSGEEARGGCDQAFFIGAGDSKGLRWRSFWLGSDSTAGRIIQRT